MLRLCAGLRLALFALSTATTGCVGPDPWPTVRASHDIETYEAFLRDHPQAPHAPEARTILAHLREQRARQLAQAAGTLAGYRDYLSRHPDAPFAAQAKTEIARLEQDADWQDNRTIADFEQFLASYPASSRAAQARAEIARLQDDAEFATASAADTLAAWESFTRAHPRSAHRAHAGRRIEALGKAEELDRIRAWIATLPAPAAGVTTVHIADVSLAPPGQDDHLLIKSGDYDYIACEERSERPAADGFEHQALRYGRPLEFGVLRLRAELLTQVNISIERRIQACLWPYFQQLGLGAHQHKFIAIRWPRDPKAGETLADTSFDYRHSGFDLQQALLGNCLTDAQLGAALSELAPQPRRWALQRLEKAGWQPADLRERVVQALSQQNAALPAADPSELCALLVGLANGPHDDLAAHAIGRIVSLDPTGDVLDRVHRRSVRDVVFDRLTAEPALGSKFTGKAASAVRDEVRREFAERFASCDGTVGQEAAQALIHLGWDPNAAENRVRYLAMFDRWDEIGNLGSTAVGSLCDLLATSPPWHRATTLQLERIAAAHGANEAADQRALADPAVRTALRAHWRPNLRPLFSAAAGDYMATPSDAAAMAELATRTDNPAWAGLARQWREDSTPASLQQLVAAGKVEVVGGGSGIEQVRIQLRNRTDHALTVRVPAGLLCAPANGNVQNMVTRAGAEVRLPPADQDEVGVPANCANFHRAIPGESETFTVQSVPEDSPLARVLAALDADHAPFPESQAAIWIVTDDANLRQLQSLTTGVFGGERTTVISPTHVARALRLLDRVGIDVRTKAIWQARAELLTTIEDANLRAWLAAHD